MNKVLISYVALETDKEITFEVSFLHRQPTFAQGTFYKGSDKKAARQALEAAIKILNAQGFYVGLKSYIAKGFTFQRELKPAYYTDAKCLAWKDNWLDA